VATPQPESGEEALDEAAMRAAEIHEVLQGLEDFKARIVDGWLNISHSSLNPISASILLFLTRLV
jgi:hypothetical protein